MLMDDKIKKYLKGIGRQRYKPLESRLNFTTQRSSGRRNNTGTTPIKVIYNWRMAPDSFEEYQVFIENVSQVVARRLSDEDAAIVSGNSFRGTDVFLLTLALYATGIASGIRDYSTHNPENRRIEIKHILSTPTKSVATGYANKYVEKNGNVSASFRKIEEPIFRRVLSDNGAKEISIPDFMLQPIVVGLGGTYRNDYEHKGFEGVAYNSTPNISTLNLLARLTGTEPQQFSEKYPLLSSKFRE